MLFILKHENVFAFGMVKYKTTVITMVYCFFAGYCQREKSLEIACRSINGDAPLHTIVKGKNLL